jgi:hypothetical protein
LIHDFSASGHPTFRRAFHFVFCQFVMTPLWPHTGQCQRISLLWSGNTVRIVPRHDLFRHRTRLSHSSAEAELVAASITSVIKLASFRAGPGNGNISPASSR